MAKKSETKNESNNLILPAYQYSSIRDIVLIIAAILVIIIGLRSIAQVLLAPILAAVFFSVILYPLFGWFRHKGFSQKKSLSLMIITLVISIIILGLIISWTIQAIRESFATYVQNFNESVSMNAESLGINQESIQTVTQSVTPQNIMTVVSAILSSFDDIMLYLVLVPILSLMILLQIDTSRELVQSGKIKITSNTERVQKFAESILIYIGGRVKVNLFTGISFMILLLFLGVDFAIVWGLLAFLLSFIPYIGLFIAGVPPVFMATAEFGITQALFVIIGLTIINFFAENVLEPNIQGSNNKLSPATIVVAFIFWTWLLGPIGALLAVPLTVLLKIVVADYKETHWLASLIEGHWEETQKSPTFPKLRTLVNRINIFKK